ncbi:MAG: chloride channel protein [Dehalococcoidia bacterium]|nr:MAG: chloride channel protein [Dehalococcoidia bacterium]
MTRANAAARRASRPHAEELADFVVAPRVIFIAALAAGVGVMSAFVAWGLLRLIGLFTNLFFFQRFGTALVSPADNSLGAFEIVVPVGGALIIGLMARYGSERIRGHGIPEALEAILIGDSRMSPRVAVLKPLSSAISIGSGGPFGAEGPIIMTGGAFGSIVGQFLHLTGAERRTLLVAGAAGGMSATFATPIAAVLLAVELLLFEWRPRSLIPVAVASATAAVVRRSIIGPGPLFPAPPHPAYIGVWGIAGCALVGLFGGFVAAILTASVYAAEDAFGRLPIHWMWWPALGGLAVGLGGLVFPEALGVGYGTIGQLLQGDASLRLIAGILIVKSLIWAVSLGSGTSGGVLAPLLMVGSAMGALAATFLPGEGAGFWPLIGMAAVLGGTMRSPFTAIVFALELTRDVNVLTPLLVAVVIAYGFTTIVMRRSILTEKVSRRGYHLSREYAIDPLETVLVSQVMRTNVVALDAMTAVATLRGSIDGLPRRVRLYPVSDDRGSLLGVVTRRELDELAADGSVDGQKLADVRLRTPVIAHPDEPLRAVAHRMAETGLTTLPVVERGETRKLAGMIALPDLLRARTLQFGHEHRREQVFRISLGWRRVRKAPAAS